ncbi:MAG: hypothetical protein HAW67_02855 [Endozoicomonadaceae bacterium]|nr:hypothetical protein [Endozoicomonadaceae bacterium]
MEIIVGRKKSIKSYLPDDIGIIERTENDDGSGDVFFTTETRRVNKRNQEFKIGFKGVPEVKKAERAINKLKLLRSS